MTGKVIVNQWSKAVGKLKILNLQYSQSGVLYLSSSDMAHIIPALRCCCGRLIAEHVGPYSDLLGHGPGPDSADEEEWSVLRHTSVSPTDAFGSLDFQGSTKRTCRAKVGAHKDEKLSISSRCLLSVHI